MRKAAWLRPVDLFHFRAWLDSGATMLQHMGSRVAWQRGLQASGLAGFVLQSTARFSAYQLAALSVWSTWAEIKLVHFGV